MLPTITWAGALAALRRWALPGVLAAAVGLSVWFGFQSQRLAGERDRVAFSLDQALNRAKLAEQREQAARRLREEADVQASAALVRAQMLTAAVERQRGTIEALEKRYGATAVSDLTRDHLRRLRAAQR